MRFNGRKTFRLIAAAHAVAIAAATPAFAGIDFAEGQSLSKFILDPDINSSSQDPKNVTLDPPPTSGGIPDAPSYQINKTFTSGNARAEATGSMGTITNSATASFTLAGGTGVAQDDPNNNYAGASKLRLNVELVWNTTSGGWGAPASANIAIPVAVLVGDGGYSRFKANIAFTNLTTGAALAPTWTKDQTFTTPGVSTQTFTYNAIFNPITISSGQKIKIDGYLEFYASNANSPSKILPVAADVGGGAPTSYFVNPDVRQSNNWSDGGNWLNGRAPGTDPKNSGERARILNINYDPISNPTRLPARLPLVLDTDISVGVIDVDGQNGVDIAAAVGTRNILVLQRGQGGQEDANAVIHVGKLYGNNVYHTLSAITGLGDNLDLDVDLLPTVQDPASGKVRGGLEFTGGIGGQFAINKKGIGSVSFKSFNTFSGGFQLQEGIANAEVAGSLGASTVNVMGGILNYNAANAIAADQVVNVASGGQVNLNVSPGASDRFSLAEGAIITGSAANLSKLKLGSSLTLSPGAVIAHQTTQEPFSLGTTPQFLYGVANNLTVNVTAGSQANTPWKGFAGDNMDRIASGDLILNGAAELWSMGDARLDLNAKLRSTSAGPHTLSKKGLGTVALNNRDSTYTGTITVQTGTLLVNVPYAPQVNVSKGGTLGGFGVLGSDLLDSGVAIAAGTLSPGDPTLMPLAKLNVTSLALNSANLVFDLDTKGGDLVLVNRSGGLSLAGKSMIDLRVNGDLEPGFYSLIDYTGSHAGSVNTNLFLGDVPTDDFIFTLQDNTSARVIGVLVAPADGPQWNVNGSGGWEVAANWIGDVPDGPATEANFKRKFTGTGTSSVSLNGDRTVGVLTFDNSVGSPKLTYSLSAGSDAKSRLILNNEFSPAGLDVLSGSHRIAVPVDFNSQTRIDIAAGALLQMTSTVNVATSKRLTKNGGGTLQITGNTTFGSAAALSITDGTVDAAKLSNGSVDVTSGTLNVTSFSETALTVFADGSVRIKRSAAPPVSVLAKLEIDGDGTAPLGTLDLDNAALVLHGTSVTAFSNYLKAVELARFGRSNGTWSGKGITSTAAAQDPDHAHTLAVIRNTDDGQTPLFSSLGGQLLDQYDTIIQYAFYGDTDLNGVLNIDDYARLELGYLHALNGWRNGDFNADGRIDQMDYSLINLAFAVQNGQAAPDSAPVPEPGALMLAASGAMLLARRRRR